MTMGRHIKTAESFVTFNMDSTLMTKQDLDEGFIVWLRRDADTVNHEAFKRSGLRKEVLDHPVLVVKLLSRKHDYVWICTVRNPGLSHCVLILIEVLVYRQQTGWKSPANRISQRSLP